MAITLIFHGGLFTILPGSRPVRRVDVHMALPERVKATGADGKQLLELEAILSSAVRLDFEGPGLIRPATLPIRPISHLVPLDYHGFRKIVGFTCGTVSGTGVSTPRSAPRRMAAIKKRANPEEMLHEFKEFAGITSHEHDQKYLNGMVGEFFERIKVKELRCWMPGYRIEVKLPARRTEVVVNGRRVSGQALPDDLRVEFRVDPNSTIPHFPLSNPHILEGPPTI